MLSICVVAQGDRHLLPVSLEPGPTAGFVRQQRETHNPFVFVSILIIGLMSGVGYALGSKVK